MSELVLNVVKEKGGSQQGGISSDGKVGSYAKVTGVGTEGYKT